jgi:hypothetical protein
MPKKQLLLRDGETILQYLRENQDAMLNETPNIKFGLGGVLLNGWKGSFDLQPESRLRRLELRRLDKALDLIEDLCDPRRAAFVMTPGADGYITSGTLIDLHRMHQQIQYRLRKFEEPNSSLISTTNFLKITGIKERSLSRYISQGLMVPVERGRGRGRQHFFDIACAVWQLGLVEITALWPGEKGIPAKDVSVHLA